MSNNKKKAKVLNPHEVPEVQRCIDAMVAIERFKAANPVLYEQLQELTEEYNTSRDAADKVLRAQEASSGPFDCYQIVTKYDAEKLYNQLGPEDFARCGGTVRHFQTTEYKVDKLLFEARITGGQVPEEVVRLVQSRTPSYHAPKPATLP